MLVSHVRRFIRKMFMRMIPNTSHKKKTNNNKSEIIVIN
jgi:hypothetical protein